MPIITLTTDFGVRDYSVGAVKGAIYRELPDVNIVDITHDIAPFHIPEAAFVIKNAYKSFPEGSIHILGVDSELTPENRHLALKLDGHYFIGADNGILSLIVSEIRPEKMVQINIHNQIESNFPVRDVFVKVAGHLARGGTLEVIGKSIAEIKQLKGLEAQYHEATNQIAGCVLYIDNYGNVVTNITRKLLEQSGKGRKFSLRVRGVSFTEIYDTYSGGIDFSSGNLSRADGNKMAVFNSGGYIEIALYRSNPRTVGSANTLLGLEWRDPVTVTFE